MKRFDSSWLLDLRLTPLPDPSTFGDGRYTVTTSVWSSHPGSLSFVSFVCDCLLCFARPEYATCLLTIPHGIPSYLNQCFFKLVASEGKADYPGKSKEYYILSCSRPLLLTGLSVAFQHRSSGAPGPTSSKLAPIDLPLLDRCRPDLSFLPLITFNISRGKEGDIKNRQNTLIGRIKVNKRHVRSATLVHHASDRTTSNSRYPRTPNPRRHGSHLLFQTEYRQFFSFEYVFSLLSHGMAVPAS